MLLLELPKQHRRLLTSKELENETIDPKSEHDNVNNAPVR